MKKKIIRYYSKNKTQCCNPFWFAQKAREKKKSGGKIFLLYIELQQNIFFARICVNS